MLRCPGVSAQGTGGSFQFLLGGSTFAGLMMARDYRKSLGVNLFFKQVDAAAFCWRSLLCCRLIPTLGAF